MESFLALITPVVQPPTQPPQPPLGIWGPTDPRPTLPIAGWNPGTGTWPRPPQGPVDPGYSPPWAQLPVYPSHPIVLPPVTPGGPPLVIWGGPWLPPYVDAGLPPFPSHPIVIPPGGVWPNPPSPPSGGIGKPPPPGGGWGYHPDYGWGYFPPGGKPLPIPTPPPEGTTPPVDPNAPVVNPLPA